MNLELAGKAVLITGGTDGLGLALATQLAAEGAAVAVCGRDEERLRVAEGEVQAVGGDVLAQRADVARRPTSRRSSTLRWPAGGASTGWCTTLGAPRPDPSRGSTTPRGSPTSSSS